MCVFVSDVCKVSHLSEASLLGGERVDGVTELFERRDRAEIQRNLQIILKLSETHIEHNDAAQTWQPSCTRHHTHKHTHKRAAGARTLSLTITAYLGTNVSAAAMAPISTTKDEYWRARARSDSDSVACANYARD